MLPLLLLIFIFTAALLHLRHNLFTQDKEIRASRGSPPHKIHSSCSLPPAQAKYHDPTVGSFSYGAKLHNDSRHRHHHACCCCCYIAHCGAFQIRKCLWSRKSNHESLGFRFGAASTHQWAVHCAENERAGRTGCVNRARITSSLWGYQKVFFFFLCCRCS